MSIDDRIRKIMMFSSVFGALLFSECQSVFIGAEPNTSISLNWKNKGGHVEYAEVSYHNLGNPKDVQTRKLDRDGEVRVNLDKGYFRRTITLFGTVIYQDTINVSSDVNAKSYQPFLLTDQGEIYKIPKSNIPMSSQEGVHLKPVVDSVYVKPREDSLHVTLDADSLEIRNLRILHPDWGKPFAEKYLRRLKVIRYEIDRRIDSIATANRRYDAVKVRP